MANIVNNLKVNKTDVKGIEIKLRAMPQFDSLKEVYYNGILIWKNANPFIFIKNLNSLDLSKYGADTIIFEGFSLEEIYGSYSVVENAEVEKPSLEKGQMIVEVTTDGGK
jgi:hypothetical protein